MSLSLSLSSTDGGVLSLSLFETRKGTPRRSKRRLYVNDESSVSRSIEIECARAREEKERERGAFFGAFCVCRFLVNAERKKKRMSHAELYN